MRYLIIVTIILLLASCKEANRSSSKVFKKIVGDLYLYRNHIDKTIKIGMVWHDVLKLFEEASWENVSPRFELEGDFAKHGGKMYAYKNPGESVLYFCTLPYKNQEVLIAISPPNGESVGGELKIVEIFVY
jgi:hypothetical protein